MRPVIDLVRPDALLVQGDTSSCFAAALSGFYHQMPVFHLEAGLRTDSLYDPFPEEMNRRLVSQLTSLHLAPTPGAGANLRRDGVDPGRIVITGNSVIDALLDVVSRPDLPKPPRAGRSVLITAHRRESWGDPMRSAARGVSRLADAFPDVSFVFPVHLNPVVREVFLPAVSRKPNVLILDPLPYAEFCSAMASAEVVLTDSGGVQEEAPSLGRPVLVMRKTTERPEAVQAGTVRLIGTDEEVIVAEVTRLLTDPIAYDEMARAVNPYGDGHAAARCVQAIEHFFGYADRPSDFSPRLTLSV
jgi:UDP-N-acetylglucosamine 2-epimerase (non-hydrolysing)